MSVSLMSICPHATKCRSAAATCATRLRRLSSANFASSGKPAGVCRHDALQGHVVGRQYLGHAALAQRVQATSIRAGLLVPAPISIGFRISALAMSTRRRSTARNSAFLSR